MSLALKMELVCNALISKHHNNTHIASCYTFRRQFRLTVHSFRTASGWQIGTCRGPWMSTVVLYCWCHSDSASVLLYFTCNPSCAYNSNLFAFFHEPDVYRIEEVCFASSRLTPNKKIVIVKGNRDTNLNGTTSINVDSFYFRFQCRFFVSADVN